MPSEPCCVFYYHLARTFMSPTTDCRKNAEFPAKCKQLDQHLSISICGSKGKTKLYFSKCFVLTQCLPK